MLHGLSLTCPYQGQLELLFDPPASSKLGQARRPWERDKCRQSECEGKKNKEKQTLRLLSAPEQKEA